MLKKATYVKNIVNLNYSLIPEDEIFIIKSKEIYFVFPKKILEKYKIVPLKIKGEDCYLIYNSLITKIYKSKDTTLKKTITKTNWKEFNKENYLIIYDPNPNKSNLNKINEHENDKHLKLDESIDKKTGKRKHDYYYKSKNVNLLNWISVTSLSKTFFPFDIDKIAGYVAKKTKKTKESIIKEWEELANQGVKVHKIIELYLDSNIVYKDETFKKQFKQFLNYNNFMENQGYFIYKSEWKIFNKLLKTVGTIDAVYYSPFEKKIILVDFKTTKHFIKKLRTIYYSPLSLSVVKKLEKGEINNYKNVMDGLSKRNKFVKYSLQLGLYKHILDTNYINKNFKFDCDEMHIVRLHKNIQNYELTKINPKDLEFRIKKMFELKCLL